MQNFNRKSFRGADEGFTVKSVCFINPGPASTNTPTVGAGGSWPDGFQVGSTSQSKVAAYGVSPAVVQRFSAAQTAISGSQPNGTLITATVSTVVPSSGTITGNTVSAMAVTFTTQGLISTLGVDFLIVNKPSAQAGIGICGALVSTVSTVLIQYMNPGTGNVTATAGEAYLMANLRGLSQSVTLTPPVVAVSTIQEAQFTVTGVAPGTLLAVQKPTFQSYLGVVGMRVVSNNLIGISYINLSSAPITPTASEAYTYVALAGLHANSNMMVANVNMEAAPVTVTTAALNTVTASVTGMNVQFDFPLSVQRQGTITTYAPIASRVSANNVMEFTYIGSQTAASVVTPTRADVLTVPFTRQNAAPPLIVQSVTLTPTAIGALTTSEVQFAVSGITVSTVVWVNKPSFTSNIGVVGTRVVSTNVIGITYVNNSAVTLTPPAETYVVGNFPNVLGVNHGLQQQVMTGVETNENLTNEVRAALVALGFIGGS